MIKQETYKDKNGCIDNMYINEIHEDKPIESGKLLCRLMIAKYIKDIN